MQVPLAGRLPYDALFGHTGCISEFTVGPSPRSRFAAQGGCDSGGRPRRNVRHATSRRSAFAGERSRYLVSTSAAYSSLDFSTAEPRLDVITTSVWSRLTRSMRPRRSRRASLAVSGHFLLSRQRRGTSWLDSVLPIGVRLHSRVVNPEPGSAEPLRNFAVLSGSAKSSAALDPSVGAEVAQKLRNCGTYHQLLYSQVQERWGYGVPERPVGDAW